MKCNLHKCPIQKHCLHGVQDLGVRDFHYEIIGNNQNHIKCSTFKSIGSSIGRAADSKPEG